MLKECTTAALQSFRAISLAVVESRPYFIELIQTFQTFYQTLKRELIYFKPQNFAVYQCSNAIENRGQARGPRVRIQEEILLHFRNIGYLWKELAEFLLVSRWTILRRVREYGIENQTTFSSITRDFSRDFKKNHGNFCRRSMILGHLSSIGLRVQQRRVSKALVRVDPVNSRRRWACLVQRRKYSVPGPNSLWNIDGHRSLIQWGFVIHGAIDGHSRLIVYLRCVRNNKKETVLELLDKAINQYGVSSRLRSDKGKLFLI